MNNLLSYCGLVDTRIGASEKDLPVSVTISRDFHFVIYQTFDLLKVWIITLEMVLGKMRFQNCFNFYVCTRRQRILKSNSVEDGLTL